MMRRLLLTSLCSLAACGGPKAVGPQQGGHETADEMEGVTEHKEGDLTVKSFDLFHSGRPSVWEYSRPGVDPKTQKPVQQLVRKEMDLNGDGKVDLWRWYGENGAVIKEALDLDFDGKVDELILFDEKGAPQKKELALNFDGKPNLWKYYEKGQLVRKERDTKGNGRVDTWEYWEGGKIDRVGVDTDGDGVVDRWTKSPGG